MRFIKEKEDILALNIDTEKFTKYYIQTKKNISFIRKLIRNKPFRTRWLKENNYPVEFICIGQLEKDLKRQLDIYYFMRSFIVDGKKANKIIIDEFIGIKEE